MMRQSSLYSGLKSASQTQVDPRTAHGHTVQFYESDAFLTESVADFIVDAQHAGENALIITTPSHRAAIHAGLQARGVDLDAAVMREKYRSMDAEETLAKLMVDGMPDPLRFQEIIGNTIQELTKGGRRLRAFGEMVAILWAQPNRAAAIRLEEMWNELAKERTFSLLCAFPMGIFAQDEEAAGFSHICSQHAQVIPTESFALITDAREQLLAVSFLQQKALRLESEIQRRKAMEGVYSRGFEKNLEATREAERRQQELYEKEHAARIEAERLSRMKDDFLATLSHELRTPLNAIFGWSQIIKQAPEDQKNVREGIAVIDRNVRAQTRLIEDLLDTSRIIAGKVRLDVQQTSLANVIEAAIEVARPSAQAKGIEIRQVLDAHVEMVSGDAGRLRQVVWNLLTNAVKFTPAGGCIEVLLERVDARAKISVNDTGQGISADFLPHVFERFRQADSSISRRHGGLGLGLSIVKQIVELHGGEVRASSAGEGKGASFVVFLPTAMAKKSQAAQLPRVMETASSLGPALLGLKGVRVLVVDDEPDARDLIGRLLKEHDVDVHLAATAELALEAMDLFRPDVLISDLGMPDMDGYQFIRAVRERFSGAASQLPAIALTAFARSADRLLALQAGFQVHVTKPIEPHELMATLSDLVRRGGVWGRS